MQFEGKELRINSNELELGYCELKRWIPDGRRISAGMDTSTVIRLHQGNWGLNQIKVYQNLLQCYIAPTVYKEFFNYQDPAKFTSFKNKERFLRLLGPEIWYPKDTTRIDDESDRQIMLEYDQGGIYLVITDNVDHFKRYQKEFPEIRVIDGRILAKILGD